MAVILFDFDGVITRLPVDWDYVRARLRRELGLTVESITKLLRRLWREDIHAYFRASRIIEEEEVEAAMHAKPIRAAVQTASLLERGHTLYIASLQSYASIKVFLELHRLENVFDGIFSRELCPYKKCMVLAASLASGQPPRSIILVDDNEANCREVSELGVKCLRVKRFEDMEGLLWLIEGSGTG